MKCSECGVEGPVFGHHGLCKDDYTESRERDIRSMHAKARAEREATKKRHPAGRGRNAWSRGWEQSCHTGRCNCLSDPWEALK